MESYKVKIHQRMCKNLFTVALNCKQKLYTNQMIVQNLPSKVCRPSMLDYKTHNFTNKGFRYM